MTQAEKVAPVPDVLAMFTVKEWRIRLMRGFLVQVFAQLTGINVISYCQASMYGALGFVGGAKLLVTGTFNAVGPVTST